MHLDPHTVHALLEKVRSQLRCPQCMKKVEVQMPSLPLDSARESSAGGQTVVELVGTGGARMRIDVTGTSHVDVVGLAQAFWSREP